MYEASLICSTTLTYMPTQYEEKENILPQQHTEIGFGNNAPIHLPNRTTWTARHKRCYN